MERSRFSDEQIIGILKRTPRKVALEVWRQGRIGDEAVEEPRGQDLGSGHSHFLNRNISLAASSIGKFPRL